NRGYLAIAKTYLKYAVLRDGKVVSQSNLYVSQDRAVGVNIDMPRFQVTPDNRLFVFFYNYPNRLAEGVRENRVLEIHPDGTGSVPVKIPLRFPLTHYFTASVRGGSAPS